MGQTRDVFYNGCLDSDDFLKLSLRFFKRNWRMGYMFYNCQKKPSFKTFFSLPRVVCMALATTTGLQCSCAARAEEGAVLSDGEQTPSFPHLLSIPQEMEIQMASDFSSPTLLHCQRRWGAHSKTQKNPTTCRAGKTCARHRAKDKLRRGHAHAPLMFCVQTERQSIVFRCAVSISDPALQRCQTVVNQGEGGSSMS